MARISDAAGIERRVENPDCEDTVAGIEGQRSSSIYMLRLVLGKFGLVQFEALFAKPETKPFGFSQIFRN